MKIIISKIREHPFYIIFLIFILSFLSAFFHLFLLFDNTEFSKSFSFIGYLKIDKGISIEVVKNKIGEPLLIKDKIWYYSKAKNKTYDHFIIKIYFDKEDYVINKDIIFN